ncbi:MAG: response regulator [Candidatus Omnitrophota bacterium]|nr:MAG: response regulator [Candidatus Omnitrophota bacterium]
MKSRILIVEDDKNMHEIYDDIFATTGGRYELIFAVSVAEAVDKLNNENFDLVILDIIMEPISGAYLYLKLNQDEKLKTKNIPVIIVSIMGEKKLSYLKKIGDVCIFEKPIEKESFLQKVEGLIETKKERGGRL